MTGDMAVRPARAHYPDLAGRRVLVTGGAAGLGLGIGEAFAGQGCRVALFDIDRDTLASAEKRLRAEGAEVLALHGSVTDPEAIERAFEEVDRVLGGLDILVNNAGISANKPTLELDLAEWRTALDVNVTGVFLCCQAAARRMLPAGAGVILNLASIYGVVAAPERLAYCASKSAVVMMSKALAIEWAGRGVRVNALAPGYVRTALVERLLEAERLDERKLRERTPLGRLGRVEEIADLALYLASDSARYVTGQVVGIDGGWSAYGYI